MPGTVYKIGQNWWMIKFEMNYGGHPGFNENAQGCQSSN